MRSKDKTMVLLESFLSMWKHAQTSLKLIRWKNYREKQYSLREQTVLQHTYAFCLLLIYEVFLLRKFNKNIDALLLITAGMVHDWGEDVRGNDVPATTKGLSDDVAECEAFDGLITSFHLPDEFHAFLMQAFLLQFAHEEPGLLFPPKFSKIIDCLRKSHLLEARIFHASEMVDYVLFAVEQDRENNHPIILKEVVQREEISITNIGRKIPGFLKEIWGPKIRKWAKKVSGRV